MKDKLIFAAVAVFVIFLLLIACGLVAMLFFMPENGAVLKTASGGGPQSTETSVETQHKETSPTQPLEASQQEMEIWNKITVANVETACLRRAKDEAGSSASLVYDCNCEETVNAGEKAYKCNISTADPFTKYFANIDCYLESATCSVETNYGIVNLTFEEINEWYE